MASLRSQVNPKATKSTNMDDVRTPAYYVVSRTPSESDVSFVQHALRITPVIAVILSSTNRDEADVAANYSENVHRTADLVQAHKLAQEIHKETGQPVLIIGDAVLFESYGESGTNTKDESDQPIE